jgi:hypothetical protein
MPSKGQKSQFVRIELEEKPKIPKVALKVAYLPVQRTKPSATIRSRLAGYDIIPDSSFLRA